MEKSVHRTARVWLTLACVIALVTTVAWAGVAGAASTSSSSPSSSSSGKVKYDPNADVSFAYSVGPVSFDPIRTLALMPYDGAIFDRLTQIDSSLAVKPMLAKSWDFSKDGSTLTLHLRDDATFTDGSKVDAAAVKANLDRSRLMPFSTQKSALSAITAVNVVDPTTVKISLASGQGVQLPSVLAGLAGMIINPKAIADPNVDLTNGPGKGMESGPYVLDSATLGLTAGEAQFVQRPDWATKYWDHTAGRIKRMKIFGISLSSQRINAVRAGDITMGQVTGVDVPQAAQLIQSKEVGGQLFQTVTTLQALVMKASRPTMSNLKFRQAIQIALDKTAFSQGLYGGYCTNASQDYPKGNFWHIDALDKKTQYSEAKAKKLLAESGVTNRTLTMAYLPIYQAQSEAAKDQLAKIGITVNLSAASTNPDDPSFAKGDFDLGWVQLVSIDPADTMNNTYLLSTPQATPIIPPSDIATFTSLQGKLADPTATPTERQQTWSTIATKLYDNAYIVPVCNSQQAWVNNKSIANMQDLLQGWSGLVDFRYLYTTKS
jgi:peptide/nickel transport system substrate-binding protein